MLAYIKSAATFRTRVALRVIDADMVLASAEGDKSNLTVAGSDVSFADAGSWLSYDGGLYLIDKVTPGDRQTSIQCTDAIDAFDRQLIYSEPPAGTSLGGYLAAELDAAYKRQADAAYAMPYLDIASRDSTPFSPPEADTNGLYSLAAAIRAARATANVVTTLSVAADALRVRITKRSRGAHAIVFSDGHSQLAKRAYSRAAVAKITTLQDGVPEDWYLATDGSVSSSPPVSRAEGAWIYLPVPASSDAEEKARERFARKAASHKIEFWSDRKLLLFDSVTIRLDGGVVRSTISRIERKTGDCRYYYSSGELAVTLTDKLRGVM